MLKLLRVLGTFAMLATTVGYASAATLVEEDFVFNYTADSSFTLSNLLYAPTSSPTSSVLGATLFPYTTATGGLLGPGTGSISATIFIDPSLTYFSNYSVTNFSGHSESFSVAVSPVPLPASFSLFAIALVCLGLVGYHKRKFDGQAIA